MSTTEAVSQFKPLHPPLPPVYPPHHFLGMGKTVESAFHPGSLGRVVEHYRSGLVVIEWASGLKTVCAADEVDPA